MLSLPRIRRWGAPVLGAWLAVPTFVVPHAIADTPPNQHRPVPRTHETDLAGLLRAAERNYPRLHASRHAISAAQARLAEAKVSPFFQFQATAGLTVAPEARGTPVLSPDDQLPLGNRWRPSYQLGVEGAIPLYTFGKLSGARRAARSGVRAARGEEKRARAQLRFDVRRAYFALQLALDARQMLSEGLGQLEKASQRLAQLIEDEDDSVNPSDQYRLSAALAELQARDSEAQNLEESSRAALALLSGMPSIRIPECPINRVEPTLEPLRHYLTHASRHRPEIGSLDAAESAREAELDVGRAHYLPDLGLAFRAQYSRAPGITDQENPFVNDPANRPTLAAGLVARWPLDFWGNVYRTRRTRAQLKQLRAQKKEAKQGIELEVRVGYEGLKDADRRERAWRKGERDTRSWFVSTYQGYEVGAAEARELIDALKAYFTARYNRIDAIRSYNTAVAGLERASAQRLVTAEHWESSCND